MILRAECVQSLLAPSGTTTDELEYSTSLAVIAAIVAAERGCTVQISRRVDDQLDTVWSFPVGAAVAAAKIVDHAVTAGSWSELKHDTVTTAASAKAVGSACERRSVQIARLVGNEFSAGLGAVGAPAFRTERVKCAFGVCVGIARSETAQQESCANQNAWSRAA